MKTRNRKNIAARKEKIDRRLDRANLPEDEGPVMGGGNVHYEMSGRQQGTACGGLGAIHEMVLRLGLPAALNEKIAVLKAHVPYYESDHILNLIYNVATGGTRLEDLERLRQDEAYLDMLGAARIPDPTTAGDFLRRLREEQILAALEVMNDMREKVWRDRASRDRGFAREGIIEIDGTIAETLGECKDGMDISYKGIWGYAPLIITLANTREVLYVINRPGNTRSCEDAAKWINLAIARVAKVFDKVIVRGDTDFSLTEHLDGWGERVEFVFGYKSYDNLEAMAQALDANAWRALERAPKYVAKGPARPRPENVKDKIVRERGYRTLRLEREDVAEFLYRPGACKQDYRMVAVRKTIHVEEGQRELFDEIRYLFYITNNWAAAPEAIVFAANDRCDQENIIAQLKSGINALHAPVGDLMSNWAYMAIAAQAWNFKAWYGLLIEDKKASRAVVRMEYKAFLQNFIALPCQIVKKARQVIVRVMGYNRYLETYFDTFDALRRLRFA